MARETRTTYETAGAYEVEHKGRALKIMVEIDGDKLTFRHKGHRQRFTLPVSDAMRAAIIHTTAAAVV